MCNFCISIDFSADFYVAFDILPTRSHQHFAFQRGMAIASLNINSLCSHRAKVKFLLNDNGIHILALNKTKLDCFIPKELTKMSGNQQLRLDRSCNGGGVSFYVRDSIKITPRADVPLEGLELLCIEISPPKSKPFLFVAWCRPPSDPVDS